MDQHLIDAFGEGDLSSGCDLCHAADDAVDPAVTRLDVGLHHRLRIDARQMWSDQRISSECNQVTGGFARQQSAGDRTTSAQRRRQRRFMCGQSFRQRPGWHRGYVRAGQGGLQRIDALAAIADHRDHRHPQFASERCGIDRLAAPGGDVGHVQCDHERPAQLDQLADQEEVACQAAGIDHRHDQVGRRRVRAQAAQHRHRHVLVGRLRDQAIGAGQVNDLDRATIRQHGASGLLLDRDAGIVGDLLPQSGEGIEQRGLAAVGIAGEGDSEGADGGHGRRGRGGHGRLRR